MTRDSWTAGTVFPQVISRDYPNVILWLGKCIGAEDTRAYVHIHMFRAVPCCSMHAPSYVFSYMPQIVKKQTVVKLWNTFPTLIKKLRQIYGTQRDLSSHRNGSGRSDDKGGVAKTNKLTKCHTEANTKYE